MTTTKFKGIRKIDTIAHYETLVSTGTVTIDGVTITYDPDFLYAVAESNNYTKAETDALLEGYVDLTSSQDISGEKTFLDVIRSEGGINVLQDASGASNTGTAYKYGQVEVTDSNDVTSVLTWPSNLTPTRDSDLVVKQYVDTGLDGKLDASTMDQAFFDSLY